MKKIKIIIAIVLIAIIAIMSVFITQLNSGKSELKAIKSEKELEKIYEGKKDNSEIAYVAKNILTIPFSAILNFSFNRPVYDTYSDYSPVLPTNGTKGISIDAEATSSVDSSSKPGFNMKSSSASSSSSSKDYSTTNIQVENVDEADITKTDGDYIYSISEDKVIITNVQDPEKIKISSKIASRDDGIPEDLILYNNKLAVISTVGNTSSYYKSNNNTVVEIYDISDKENPRIRKSYILYEPYYTSRCIDGKLYVISSGNLRKENDKIATYYSENYNKKEIDLSKIKYLKDIETKTQTLLSMVDLNNLMQDINVSSYLMDISNAYVSENSIYLLNQKYRYSQKDSDYIPISSAFGFKGILGVWDYEDKQDYYSSNYYTDIYKFDFKEDGNIEYACKNSMEGKTINQYSVDEFNNTLRVALSDSNGSRVVVFDKKLNEIGKTDYLAKGENMYSSRFMGNKAYLVTYKTVDPLFVIDLSNPSSPKILGKLKIPGYSTYLHPYDENHLIGIGMETKETVNRNSYGKVTSTTARIVGMKMALFDVSDVENPKQISNIVIGDSRTTSSILTNPKALLFSKEKQLIAIPVNNYAKDFEISSSEDYSSVISSYTNNSKSYISEGYIVYNINLDKGFEKKGMITHDSITSKYSYSYASKLLRGMNIDNNLYTVSESMIKVNSLSDLKLISELMIKGQTEKKEILTEVKQNDNIVQ